MHIYTQQEIFMLFKLSQVYHRKLNKRYHISNNKQLLWMIKDAGMDYCANDIHSQVFNAFCDFIEIISNETQEYLREVTRLPCFGE